MNRRSRSSRVAARVTLAYLMLAGLWILASDSLVDLALDGPAAVWAQTYKGLGFVTFTSLGLYLLLRRLPLDGQPGSPEIHPPRAWVPLLIFACFALALVAAGLSLFHAQRQQIRTTAEAQLKAVGELRVEQIGDWLRTTRTNAEHFGRASQMVQDFEVWLAGGGRDVALAAALHRRMALIRETYGYGNVALYDLAGEPRMSESPDPALAEHRADILEVLASGRSRLADFHYHGDAREDMLAMIAPLRADTDAGGRVVGAILFALPARQTLFATLDRWPAANPSGETVLVRREGREHVRVLYASRQPDRPGLGPLVKVDSEHLPGLTPRDAGQGRLLQVNDYRQQPVLAYARPIAHTPWTLVAKLDQAEVDAPVQRLAKVTALVSVLLLAAAGLATWLWWRAQANSQRAQLLSKELERQVLAKRFETLSRYASDAILLTDDSGTILEANQRAENLYGYTREELIGLHSSQLLPPEAKEDFLQRRAETLDAGQLLFEAEHQRKDGSRFPVEVNAHVIQLHGVRHGHLTIRDISERQAAAAKLHMQAMVLDQIQDQIAITDLEGRITYVNDALCRKAGFPREQLLGRDVSVFGNDPGTDASQALIARATLVDGHWQGRITNTTSDGDRLAIELRTTLIRDARNQPVCMVGVGSDITERQRAEQALQEREARYRAVIETSPDGFWMLDREGTLLEVNDAYCQRSGYTREELLGMTISDLDAREDAEAAARHARQVMENGSALFEALHRTRDGGVWQVEVNTTYSPIQGGRFFVFLRDIHRRNRADALLRTRLELSDLALKDSLENLMKAALDAAELFTGSHIGFFHFVDPDQETITLQAWSSHTVDKMCSIEAQHQAKGQHYPVSKAGVWADAIRRRLPIIHNDYEHLADRHGLPEGHAPLLRELVVPILREDKVVAVLGVGNKISPYDQDDLVVTEQLASMVMDVVARKQTEQELERLNAQLLEAQHIARLGNWEYDVARDQVVWSPEVHVITGWPTDQPVPGLEGHRQLFHPDDLPLFEASVQRAMTEGAPFQFEIRIRRPDGEIRHVMSHGEVRRDEGDQVTHLYGTIQDITERKLAEARLDVAIHQDPLTGLPNARRLLSHLALALLDTNQPPPALLVLNVDRFAQLNESLGRAAGDQALCLLARRWAGLLPEGALLARLDADQFAVLWRPPAASREGEDTDPAREVYEVARQLLDSMAAPVQVGPDERSVSLTLSLGVAMGGDGAGEGADATALLHAAEDAMRNAKADKGNQIRFFDRRHAQAAIDWFDTETALRQALAGDELFLLYQPQVDAATGRVAAAEALLRWRRDGQVVAPGRFIHVVEGTDLAEPVSRWVLRAACRQAREWLDRQHPVRVAVNIFSDHVTSGRLLEDVGQALEEAGLPAYLLELEVLESSLLKHPETAARTLRDIKRLGVGLALDDFGTGYSSLGYLKHYPFDVLKIDQIFARNVTRDPEDAAIVRSTIALAHNLGMRVLAEGVETEPQLRFMARYGCDQVQGYLTCRPSDPQVVETLVMERQDLRPEDMTDPAHAPAVLVIEDDPIQAELLALALTEAGHRVRQADGLDMALDIMGRETIDLVVADYYLAGETGTDILARLRPLFPDVPAIMVSSALEQEVVREALNRGGIRAFLPKPVDPAALAATARRLLDEARHG